MQYRMCVLLVLALSQIGCNLGRILLTDVARNKFSRRNSCPVERMTMNVVPVEAKEILTLPDAPPHIAADAGRLAVWNENLSDWVASYMDLTAVRVRGCEVDETYICWDERSDDGEDLDFICEEIDLGDPRSKLGSFTLNADVMDAVRERLAASRARR